MVREKCATIDRQLLQANFQRPERIPSRTVIQSPKGVFAGPHLHSGVVSRDADSKWSGVGRMAHFSGHQLFGEILL